jgi:hypothetical protein
MQVLFSEFPTLFKLTVLQAATQALILETFPSFVK